MPRSKTTTSCPHCDGELVLYGTTNPAKVGRVYCDSCACAFLYGERVTQGASCAFAPPEVAGSPPPGDLGTTEA